MTNDRYIHAIDPIFGQLAGVYFWYYGLIYTLGFAFIFWWFRINRRRYNLSPGQVYDFSILVSLFVLIGGRAVAVFLYEWDYYGEHPQQILAYWIGGMGSHGLLLGAITGMWIFARVHGRPFLEVTDAMVIPGAMLMAFGRIANFVDGQIVGSISSVPWAVKFPDADGYRHPVVLYDAVKNLLLVPIFLLVGRFKPRPGILTGHFMFWYGFLRIFVDLFRDYRADMVGIPTGQVLNGSMALAGLLLIVILLLKDKFAPVAAVRGSAMDESVVSGESLVWRRMLLVVLLLFCFVLPSDRTQDVPETYGKRHPGLTHSAIYPPVDIR